MSPQQRLQRLLAEIPEYEPMDIVTMLPLAAAFLSALCARTAAVQQPLVHQPQALPDTDYLFSANEIAQRMGKSSKWVRENIDQLPFALRIPGKEHRFSARRFDEWINENLPANISAALPPERRQYER